MAQPTAGPSEQKQSQSILSSVQSLSLPEEVSPTSIIHPFSESPDEILASLRGIVNSTNQISQSLNTHLSLSMTDSKLLSLFRQYTTIINNVHVSDQTMRSTLVSLRKRQGIEYGEDVPLIRTTIPEWFVARLKYWAASAGMETFPEQREGHMTVVLGGKVLVIDIDFLVDRKRPDNPMIDIATLKTSFAVPNSTLNSTTDGSVCLDGSLADSLRAFLREVHKDEEVQDTLVAAKYGVRFQEHLKYLMKLDKLAFREGDRGLRWFSSVDRLATSILEPLAVKEAQAIISSNGVASAPLDLFVMRGHALPLPYLDFPSISFLIFVSPKAYLTLLKTPPAPSSPVTKSPLSKIDIPFSILRPFVSTQPRPLGITTATLVLGTSITQTLPPDTLGMHDLMTRPTFPLHPAGENFDYTFIEISEPIGSQDFGKTHRWFLDFTDSGKRPGVVMSQTRMREIESILNPLSSIDHMGTVPTMSLSLGSWVDLLLNPGNVLSPERYTALYTSPSSAHPPLQLRLTSPEEPGFFLEKVPVQNMKQVWGTLEIVREQCWLNEILNGLQWTPEGLTAPTGPDQTDEGDATEADLQAVLGGSITPNRIPVILYLPTQPTTVDPLFDSTDLDAMTLSQPSPHTRHTKIVMTSPERPPITGLVEITVAFDPTRPKGIALNINGAIGADLNVDTLEEVCRRGGLLGLPGRVWTKSNALA